MTSDLTTSWKVTLIRYFDISWSWLFPILMLPTAIFPKHKSKIDLPFLFSLRAASLFPPSGRQWQLVMILFKYLYTYLFSISLTRI